MRVRVVLGAEVLTSFGPALDDLHAAVGVPICARRPWLRAWADSYDDYQPWAVLIENKGCLEAAALLARKRRRGLLNVVGLGDGQSDYMRLPARTREASLVLAEGLVDALKCTSGPWRFRASSLPAGDPVADILAHEFPHSRVIADATCPALHFGPTRELSSYLGRSSRHDRNLSTNRIHRDGLQLTYQYVHEASEIARILPEVERLHRRRDASLGRGPLGERWWSFWRRVILEHAGRHEVEIITLRLNSSLSAYAVCFLDGMVCRFWDTRFDPTWAKYSPGMRVNETAVEWALSQESIEEFDWMRGQEPYKLRLSNTATTLEALFAWSSPAARVSSESQKQIYLWARRFRANRG